MSLPNHPCSPIAVVGVGVRFPGGVRTLADYGRLLSAGTPAFSPVPPDRWGPERRGSGPGRTTHHVGAFLEDVDRFDPRYFGIPPDEAALLDPQHRLFLEVAWEAMSDSGRPRAAWAGTRTAVIVGMLAQDYTLLHARTLGLDAVGPHHVSGLEHSFAAGRLAYAFDLRGPAQAVNSACSSALLAVHQACQALRAGECDAALAGGVSLQLTPDNSVFLSGAGALSPSGRCRPFDAAADGIVRGEGCGAVVLRRLDEALADGDRVYALVLGSAVVNDGASLGLTVPNAQAQKDMIGLALHASGLGPADVDYVEAHGTGTPLGDLIELGVLAEVYGSAHDAGHPVHVGSHKALLGHMDAAAGMGGLLKAVWVAATGTVPAQPGVETPNPAVDWRGGALRVPDQAVRIGTVPDAAGPLGAEPGGVARPARAAVSAFGLSGTDVHVIVQAPPSTPDRQGAGSDPDAVPATMPDTASSRPLVLLASAPDAAGLARQVDLLRAEVRDADADLGDLLASAATRRTHEARRFAAVAEDRGSLLAALDELGDLDGADALEDLPAGAYAGHAADPADAPGPVFVLPGQGGQWAGMALDLYQGDAVVREALEECAELIRAEAGWSLLDELRREPDRGRPDRIAVAQPAIFAVQVALARWLARHGVRPAAVVGHSLGEAAAAHIAGALDLADAVRLIVRRSRILADFTGIGRMAAVQARPSQAAELLGGLAVDVVAVNGPSSLVVAGASQDMDEAASRLTAAGIQHRVLRVDAPAHSRLVAKGGPRLERALSGLVPRPPAVRLVSSVDPKTENQPLDAGYWARNFTSAVLLWPAIDRLLAEEDHPLLEIGPHPVLLPPLADAQRARQRRAPALGTLDRDLPGRVALTRTLVRLHVAGVEVDWTAAVGRPLRYRTLPLPSWRDGRYWLPGVARGEQGLAPGTPPAPANSAPADSASAPRSTSAASPATAPTSARAAVAQIDAFIDETVRELLGLPADAPALGRRRGLFEQGLDSLRAAALRRRLEGRFSCELPSTVVLDHPSIRALAEHLAATVTAEHLARAMSQDPESSDAESAPATAHDRDADTHTDASSGAETGTDTTDTDTATATDAIAVIGIGCRLPGADSPAAYWRLLASGERTAAGFPPGRRDDPLWRSAGARLPDRGSFLADIAGFDAPFFRVSPREARLMDPEQRLFLEVAWEALQDAGCPATALAGQPVGVYAGVGASVYQNLVMRGLTDGGATDAGAQSDPVSLHHGTGTDAAILAGRLAYLLGLSGPALAVNTACSSSLVAVHLAMQALRSGDCALAVVGGAHALSVPGLLMASMSASGAMAPDGVCKTFDEDADGFGIGEGAAVVILKPLDAALRDGDRVHAVLRASAVNQDGATAGMTVPERSAQTAVLRAALHRAGWDPADVDYVEAHGTGTPLGDPIEIGALADALGPGRADDGPLLVGSAKAAIGHLGPAAGVAALLKVVLALREGQVPPHPLSSPSTRIAWDRLPVTPVRGLTTWPRRGRPARAGVSAFGFSGTNAHVLVEQAPAPAAAEQPREQDPLPQVSYLLPVSAATPAALQAVAARMAEALRAGHADVADIVFTAAHRRMLLEHRAVAVGADAGELAEALDHVAAGRPHPRVRTGRVEPGEVLSVGFRYGGVPSQWSNPGDREAAATRRWAALGVRPDAVTYTGAETDAEADRIIDVLCDADPALLAAELIADGYQPHPARRGTVVDLPAYPWEHRRYWYPDDAAEPPAEREKPVIDGTVASLPLAADSAEGLRDRAHALAVYLRERTDAAPAAVARALASRPPAPHRLVVSGGDVATLLSGLDAAAADSLLPRHAVQGHATGLARPVMIFPGQGWQWAGMGRDLLDRSPVFADTIAECAEVIREAAGWSLADVLREGRDLDRVEVLQPASFAVLAGLVRLWRELGVSPAAVVGHSQGEIAAAFAAGVVDLPEATRLAVVRAQVLSELTGVGALVAVGAGTERTAKLLEDGWSVAAVNGPSATVVAGPAATAERLTRTCEAEGIRCRVIPASLPTHTARVEVLRESLLRAIGTVACRAGHTPMYSTVTGAPIDGSAMDSEYWYANIRHPVRFQAAIEAMADAGHTVFVECSAHPVLAQAVEETLDRRSPAQADGQNGAVPAHTVIATLHRDGEATADLHIAAARAWAAGVDLRWGALLPAAVPADLPDLDRPRPEESDAAGREDAVDRRFWRIVEDSAADELATALGFDDGRAAALAEVLPALADWRRRARERAVVDGWRYRSAWIPAPDLTADSTPGHAPGPRNGTGPATWLVAVGPEQLDEPFVRACLAAVPGARTMPVSADRSRASLAEELRRAADGASGILSLLALDELPAPGHPAVPSGLLASTVLLKALEDSGAAIPLWALTRADRPLQSHVNGLIRTAGAENPDRWFGLVEVPAALDETAAERLRAVLAAAPAEDQLAVREDGIHVRRLVRAPLDEQAPRTPWRPGGTVLITGGTGGIAGHVARWIARHGTARLLLLSRRGPEAPGAGSLREELLGLGAPAVTIASCDVSDPAALAAVLAELPEQHPLTAVFHAAGVVDEGPLTTLTGDQLQAVLAPKTAAVHALHEATAGCELSAFVLFSSLSSMLPSIGQAGYAAANAYLDAFARWRRASGLPALSVSWGTWAGAGMGENARFQATISRGWMEQMTAHLAVTGLRDALEGDESELVIAALDWSGFTGLFGTARRYPLVADLVEFAGPAGGTDGRAAALLEKLRTLPPRRREEEALAAVRAQAATVLGHARGQDVRPDRAFRDLGFDSVTGIELRNRLAATTGVRVAATAIFDHPTPEALARHLLDLIAPPAEQSQGPDAAPPPAAAAPDRAADRFAAMDVEALIRTAQHIAS